MLDWNHPRQRSRHLFALDLPLHAEPSAWHTLPARAVLAHPFRESLHSPSVEIMPTTMLLPLFAAVQALNLPARGPAASTAAAVSALGRRDVFVGGTAAALGLMANAGIAAAEEEVAPAPPPPPPPPPMPKTATTATGLKYTVVKTGSGGGKPKVGDLIAIRFKGAVKETGAVFDDIMGSAEPYYTRVGSGNVLPAVEEAVKLMRSGDGSGCAARTPDAPIPAPGRAARARPRRAPTRSSPRPSAQSGS